MKLPDDDTLATATLDTPIGLLRLAAIDDGLAMVLFPNQEDVAFPKRVEVYGCPFFCQGPCRTRMVEVDV